MGFNVISRASEANNYIFMVDNWSDEFIELKTGKIRTYEV